MKNVTIAGLLALLALPLASWAQAPVNDDPAGAIVLPLAATCTPTSATNVGATTTAPNGYANPGCGIALSPKDVWFRFTTDATGPGSTAAAISVTAAPAGQVRLFASAGGGTGPFTPLGCASGGSNNSQAARLVVVGLMPATSYYVSVSGYNSTDTQGGFSICATVPVANDVAMEAVLTLTQLPIPAGAPHVVQAVVSNQGSTAQANLAVTLTVAGANTFTNTQTVAALAPGASATVSFAAFTPTATGSTRVRVSVPADDNMTNNSRSVTQEVNSTTYSYADPGGATGAFQVAVSSNHQAFACRYRVSSPVSMTQVRSHVVNGSGGLAGQPSSTIGKTVYGVVFDPNTGALLARSADHVVTAADINTYVTLPLTTQVVVPAGTDVLVGMVSVYPAGQTVNYAPFGIQSDGPGRTNAFYYINFDSLLPPRLLNSNTGGYQRLMIEAVTQVVTATRNEALAATVGLYPNPAHGTFALAVPAGPLGAATATLHNALGQVVQVRPLALPAAGGTREFDVRGLAAGVYTLQLQTSEALVVKRVVLE